MGNTNSIPITFGVTGHRDLRGEDIEKLEESVHSLFKKYQSAYPHTELIVISALAEGADMLVARVAKNLGVALHVLLPYQEEEYMDSFEDKENAKSFQALKTYASKVEVNSCVHTHGHESCYQQLGERIADVSNILIALWDGTDNGKVGGTSAIVRYTRQGHKNNHFDQLDGNALFIITTPRQSNPTIETDYSVQAECLSQYVKGEEFEKMYKKIDDLNKEYQDEVKELKDRSILKTFMGYFDSVADKNQKRYKGLLLLILALTWFAIASLEIMHVLHIEHFTSGYGLGLLGAFGVYWFFMKKGKVQDDFVHSRGLAEAIRIQNAWNHAGLNQPVARYYLSSQHHKFTWMKIVLKNLFYLDREPFSPYGGEDSVEHWVDGQIDYFKKAAAQRHKKLKRLELLEHVFHWLGFVALVVMFTVYVLESLHVVDHGGLWFNWHYMVLVSGLLLLTAAFIGERYMKIEGYEEEIYHFNAMLGSFEDAKESLASVEKGNQEYKELVFDLGLKALDENSKWVVLHDSRRAEPSLD